MEDTLAALDRLLELERQAALRADVDALADVQESKRSVLERLTSRDAEHASMPALKLKAAANVQLIRHLVSCLNGMLTPVGSTYTAQGRSPTPSYGRSRGHR